MALMNPSCCRIRVPKDEALRRFAAWTLIQDLSGCLGFTRVAEWLKFAERDKLVFAGYNDAIGYGELTAVSGGKVTREFLIDTSSSEEDVNVGRIDSSHEPFKNWVQIAGFVDDDELAFCDAGWLWILKS